MTVLCEVLKSVPQPCHTTSTVWNHRFTSHLIHGLSPWTVMSEDRLGHFGLLVWVARTFLILRDRKSTQTICNTKRNCLKGCRGSSQEWTKCYRMFSCYRDLKDFNWTLMSSTLCLFSSYLWLIALFSQHYHVVLVMTTTCISSALFNIKTLIGPSWVMCSSLDLSRAPTMCPGWPTLGQVSIFVYMWQENSDDSHHSRWLE